MLKIKNSNYGTAWDDSRTNPLGYYRQYLKSMYMKLSIYLDYQRKLNKHTQIYPKTVFWLLMFFLFKVTNRNVHRMLANLREAYPELVDNPLIQKDLRQTVKIYFATQNAFNCDYGKLDLSFVRDQYLDIEEYPEWETVISSRLWINELAFHFDYHRFDFDKRPDPLTSIDEDDDEIREHFGKDVYNLY